MTAPVIVILGRSTHSVIIGYDQEVARVSSLLGWDDGFTLTVNAVPTAINSVTKVANGLWLTVTAGFAIGAAVTVAYAGVNLKAASSVTLVPTFTSTPANLASGYPSSTVTTYPLNIVNNVVEAKIALSLNPIDRELVIRYKPYVTKGGTFGAEVILDTTTYLGDGTVISYSFNVTGNVTAASQDAALWLSAMNIRVGDSLAQARLLDDGISFGTYNVVDV